MKKLLISTLVVSALGMASQFAAAADGTITFTGAVTSTTCTINGNGGGTTNFTVTLPTVSASSLATSGNVAGRTPFNISLTGCNPASGNVHTFFETGSTTDLTTGNLILNTGGATNVQIQLLNGSDASAIKAGFVDASQNSTSVAIAAGGTATLPYFAQYIATGTATAGTASSSVMYTMSYN